jgi:ADP-ribose pyrophosphatase YjhB (NUDIX family)
MSHTGKNLCLTVTANITYKNEVLLVFHKEYKSWFPPGGHIKDEEDPESAIYREILEETSLTKNNLTPVNATYMPKEEIFSDMNGNTLLPPLYIDIHQAGANHKHVGMRFFFTSNKKGVISSDKDIKELKWFNRMELDDSKYNLRKHVKFYGISALKFSESL